MAELAGGGASGRVAACRSLACRVQTFKNIHAFAGRTVLYGFEAATAVFGCQGVRERIPGWLGVGRRVARFKLSVNRMGSKVNGFAGSGRGGRESRSRGVETADGRGGRRAPIQTIEIQDSKTTAEGEEGKGRRFWPVARRFPPSPVNVIEKTVVARPGVGQWGGRGGGVGADRPEDPSASSGQARLPRMTEEGEAPAA